MSRSYPFRRPPADVVRGGPWMRVESTGPTELPAALPDWDYGTTLTLSRSVRVDAHRARSTCGLPGEAALDLSVRWASSTSLLRGRACRVALPDDDDLTVELDVALDGDELGGHLDLDTVVTLRAAPATTPASSPRRPGSVLWSDSSSTLLQGDAALFPLVVTDFASQLIPTDAPWYVEIGSDLHAAALGSILLLANQRHPAVVTALTTAGAPDESARRILSMLRTDVVRSMVEHALVDVDFDDDTEYATGSLGSVLQALFCNTFDLPTVESLRRERETSPALFTAHLQDATKLLAGP